MSYLIVCTTAFVFAGLTLISGFGLGTLLLPAFIIFFPAEIAVVSTAVVHLLNNIFKLFLVGKHADMRIVVMFAVPAAAAAFLGAYLLTAAANSSIEYGYELFSTPLVITPVKILIGLLMFVFGLFEMVPAFKNFGFSRRYVPLGGVISGFFGGLSGHQGALRAAFLINVGLSKESFIGTSVLSAIVVDISRLAVYGFTLYESSFALMNERSRLTLLIATTCAAFLGSYAGSRMVKRVTLGKVRSIVGTMLILLAIFLCAGLI
jgi:uncharacterized membrane protein YfcA